MLTVYDYAVIRHAYYVEEQSIRTIAERFGLARQNVRKALESAEARRYTLRAPRAAPRLDPYRHRVEELGQQNVQLPRKQRYTAQRIFQLSLSRVPATITPRTPYDPTTPAVTGASAKPTAPGSCGRNYLGCVTSTYPSSGSL